MPKRVTSNPNSILATVDLRLATFVLRGRDSKRDR
jgi:hypothetical protein